jgi:hypothetical protein
MPLDNVYRDFRYAMRSLAKDQDLRWRRRWGWREHVRHAELGVRIEGPLHDDWCIHAAEFPEIGRD